MIDPIVGRWGRAAWSRWLARLVEATLFPAPCPLCDRLSLDQVLCADCADRLAAPVDATCPRCAMPVGPFANREGACSECRGRSLGFSRAIALGPYRDELRDLCIRLKRPHEAWLARWLVGLLLERRAAELRAYVEASQEFPVVIVPVAQHWRRSVQKRFHNQADSLAEELSGRLKVPWRRLLRRVKPTPKLAGRSRTERMARLKRAFRASPRRVAGRRILLVDDILTSGATCGAAARALKRAGAKDVVVVVIGRAEGNA